MQQASAPPPADTPMQRVRFIELSDAQQMEMLDGIRHRRLAALERYKQQQVANKAAAHEKLDAKIAKSGSAIDKNADKINELIDKLEELVSKHAALVLMRNAEDEA